MRNWFNKVREEFPQLAMLRQGCGCYVEVGVWTGDSAAWVMENVQPKTAYGIDPYLPDPRHPKEETDAIYKATKARVELLGMKLFRCASHQGLRLWPPTRGKIDLLYLDGRHDAAGVVLDFCLAWEYLADDAVVILDDFGIGKRKVHRHVPEAVEAIALAFGDQVDYFHRGPRQAAFRIVSKEPPLEPNMQRYVAINSRREKRKQRRSNRALRIAARNARIK